MQDFKKLQVWQKSHDLTVRIYELTSRFPREEWSSCQLPVNTPLLIDYSKCGGC